MGILNKALVGISFATKPSLNIVASDLLDTMFSISYEGDSGYEIPGATSTMQGVNFYKRANVAIHIRADSPKYSAWMEQVNASAMFEGNATLLLDNGETILLSGNLRIDDAEYDNTGQAGDANFILRGDRRINKDLAVGIS